MVLMNFDGVIKAILIREEMTKADLIQPIISGCITVDPIELCLDILGTVSVEIHVNMVTMTIGLVSSQLYHMRIFCQNQQDFSNLLENGCTFEQ